MAIEIKDSITNTTLIIADAGNSIDGLVKIKIESPNDLLINYVNKPDAQQIIDHLKYQFGL